MKQHKAAGILIAFFACLALAACSNASAPPADGGQNGAVVPQQTAYPLEFTDALGKTVTLPAVPQRIVSMVPSVTESLFAIGAGPQVIANSEWCTYPAEAAALEKIGNAYTANIERILELNADAVIVAGAFGDDSVAALSAAGIPVISMNYDTVDSLYKSVTDLGVVANRQQEASSLVERLKGELAAVESAYAGAQKNKVFLDLGNLYSSSQKDFLGNAIQLLGCENIAYGFDMSSPQLSSESVIEANPDVYIATFPKEGTVFPDGFEDLSCFKNSQVYYINYDDPIADVILRPGPRFVEGLKELGKMVHPDVTL
jgi:iron complex transport system substrate-binding protein